MVRLEDEYSLICQEFTIQKIPNNLLPSSSEEEMLNSSARVITRCVCDFRINFSGCEEENTLRTLHWILVPYCMVIIIIAVGFLYYRNYILKQSFWLPSTRERGLLRPKPQEVIHSITIIFNLFHLIHIMIVLLDAYPNYSMAEIGQDLSRELSIGVALLYPISIIYTTPTETKTSITNNNTTSNSFNSLTSPPNRHIVDMVGFTLLIAPISTLFPLAWMTGHYADVKDYVKAISFCKLHNLILMSWAMIFVISLIYYWYKLIIIIWNYIKELKRKEVSGTSEMQWTVTTLKRAAKNLCLAISSLLTVILFIIIMSLAYVMLHRSNTIFNSGLNIAYVFIWNFTIPIILNLIQFYFLYKTIRPQPPSSVMASKFTLTEATRKKKSDSLRDDESLISGGGGGTTTATTPITSTSPFASPITPAQPTPIITTTNFNNTTTDYFNHSNSNSISFNGLNAATINSMTNNILQNKTSIEINRNEAYIRLNSNRRSISRSSSQNLIHTTHTNANSEDTDDDNSLFPLFLTPINDRYHRNSVKRPSLLVVSDEQISNVDSAYNKNSIRISNGKRISTESIGIRRISKSSITNSIGIVSVDNGNDLPSNLSIRRISNQIKHQKSFEGSMDLIAEEITDGSQRQLATTTKRNRSSVSVSREASDAISSTVVTTSTTYSSSTFVSTTTTIINPVAAAAAKASWDNPDDIGDNPDDIEDNPNAVRTPDSMEKREWLTKRPVSPIPRRKTLPRFPSY